MNVFILIQCKPDLYEKPRKLAVFKILKLVWHNQPTHSQSHRDSCLMLTLSAPALYPHEFITLLPYD